MELSNQPYKNQQGYVQHTKPYAKKKKEVKTVNNIHIYHEK